MRSLAYVATLREAHTEFTDGGPDMNNSQVFCSLVCREENRGRGTTPNLTDALPDSEMDGGPPIRSNYFFSKYTLGGGHQVARATL